MTPTTTFQSLCLRAAWLLCALAPFTLGGCGNSAGKEPSQVAAKVNDAEISVHQINFVLQRQTDLQPDQVEPVSKEVLERLIDQEFAVQKATKLKIDHEPSVMQALAAARREVLARAYASRVADSASKPEPSDIRAYYDAKPALYAQRRVYMLQELMVQADEAQTAALRDKVRSAKTMPEVLDYLKAQSLPARTNQSTQAAENLPPQVLQHLSTLRDGQALMMPAPLGARLIFVAGSRVVPLTLEQATPNITQALMAERRRDAVDKEMKALRTDGHVKYLGKFALAASGAGTARAQPAQQAMAPLPSTSPASGATPDNVDAAAMRRGLSGLN